MFKIKVLSRHPSHNILRKELPVVPIKSLIRLGSTTDKKGYPIEINTINSINISSNKKLMKQRFDEVGAKTAKWIFGNSISEIKTELENNEISYPIIAKSLYGSRGIGNTKIDDEHHLENWSNGKNISNYIFEKFYNYLYEYRIHVTTEGYFYTCRKALKRDSDENSKWRRHKDNSVWLLEENENFNKPNSWNDIINDCLNSLKTIGADILSFDVKVQSKIKGGESRKYQDYILLECNSASSMQSDSEISICAKKYIEQIPLIILNKSLKLGYINDNMFNEYLNKYK